MRSAIRKHFDRLGIGITLGILVTQAAIKASASEAVHREAVQLQKDGNYREALDKFRQITLESDDAAPDLAARCMALALQCYQQLNEVEQIDAFLEDVVRQYGESWRVLQAAGSGYLTIPHHGYIVAGEFRRGSHRGGGNLVNANLRDRAQALRLLHKARQLAGSSPEARKAAVAAGLLDQFAAALLFQHSRFDVWRLQSLTNLDELPDYEEGWGYYGDGPSAPVDADGNPVFYEKPESWEAAESDGERWRWTLATRTDWQPELASRELLDRAAFLQSQFGVESLAQYGWFFHSEVAEADVTKAKYDLDTLSDGETIARLASGIERLELPERHNHIALLKRVVEQTPQNASAWRTAAEQLGQVYENRRQYPKAAELWRQRAAEPGGNQNSAKSRLQQIVGNWGRFEPVLSQPAGRGATIDFRFRNGERVEFTAHRIKVSELLSDVKTYVEQWSGSSEWQGAQFDNLGYRLVTEGQEKYLGEQAAQWLLELEPLPNHFDRRITVSTPLHEPGAYLLTAKMEDGNTHRVVVWLQDTAIVKKPLEKESLYFVADAATGQPIARCNVEFFGFRIDQSEDGRRRVATKNFAELTDANGMVRLPADETNRRLQWLATATTPGGRFAYLGYSGVWLGQRHDAQYKQVKSLAVTDRPVYRPGDEVHFKFWVRNAQYDMPDESRFANQTFQVEIRNPRNERVFSESLVADAYGGLAGDWKLPQGAVLGQYTLLVVNHGGGTFRVEQYKKPEFEVTVEAPDEPVTLGEAFTATINANYYFGSPVASATVKYKVLRTSQVEQWFPPSPWDWLYGPGYGWLGEEYHWYPGWARWGCSRPAPWWIWRAPTPPEVVAEREVAIGPDGQVKIEVDTALAEAMHPDQDHRYEIQAEVVDQSRRTIVGKGAVLVARQPFQVRIWTDRGFYQAGEAMQVSMSARTIDGQPVTGDGVLRLLKIGYEERRPIESEVANWALKTNQRGAANLQITAAEPGQYRLSFELADDAGRKVEGGRIVTIRGDDFGGAKFRFNDLELVPEKREYRPGESIALQINVDHPDAAVLLFVRPSNGVYLPPRLIKFKGKSTVIKIDVQQSDMPNFFIEGIALHGGRLHQVVREIYVPPVRRVINVEAAPSANAFLPGQQAQVKLKLTDQQGQPVVGSTVVAIYDKALEYVSGGGNVPDIREFFWKWRRLHQPQSETNLERLEHPIVGPNDVAMYDLGIFGGSVADEASSESSEDFFALGFESRRGGAQFGDRSLFAHDADALSGLAPAEEGESAGESSTEGLVEPTVRMDFADTALWVGSLQTGASGMASVDVEMPENLTTWKINVWAMGHGTRVGQGSAEVVTRKNLIVRLQTPRFLVERDEAVISANIHNYLDESKAVRVRLETDSGVLALLGEGVGGPIVKDDADASPDWIIEREIVVPAGGEQRVDWRVRVDAEGQAVVRVSALTDEESDAMQLSFPTYVHGMLKTESFSGAIRSEQSAGGFAFRVPRERRPEQTRLEIRYSPTLAGAMVDALPYLIDYPYGCTEQTLNRFLPAVITQQTLRRMNVDLAAVLKSRTNLNAQEIGDDRQRAAQWMRFNRNPVFDEAELETVVQTGINRLTEMQLADGGWGWFTGWGEQSTPHTTAVVVHGLLIARQNDVTLVPGVLERGVQWLQAYQARQIAALDNWDRSANKARREDRPAKRAVDNIDALAYMVLTEAERDGSILDPQAESPNGGVDQAEQTRRMRDYLYQDRTQLAAYSLAMFGLALHWQDHIDQRDMVVRNLSQFLKQDPENQTAWLDLSDNAWWNWYGSENEALAYYLKLLVAVEPESPFAPRIVKYLLNNRRHDSRWNSTRDTALVIEAFADYLAATGENQPDLQLEVWIDGHMHKRVAINAENLLSFDNSVVVEGADLEPGDHAVELRKTGSGPIYFNGYLSNFTLEDPIDAAGLEIKVERRYYLLTPKEKVVETAGGRGQPVGQRVDAYDRAPIDNFDSVESGDLVEVELIVESKNDYEYILLEDMKAAGFEPVEVRSGYNGNQLGAYVEYHDDRVGLFVSRLMRGRHSVSYRLRAEVPGQFSALPTRASAMYAPELKANSNEFKIRIFDQMDESQSASR